jgi:hypothetical protein
MLFMFFPNTFLEKSTPVLVKTCMSPIRKQEQAHRVKGHA